MNEGPDNQTIYDDNWHDWLDMKVHGPASRWLRHLIRRQVRFLQHARCEVASVLDVGCGEGTITHMLAELMPQANVTGIDFSSAGIEAAKARYERHNLDFRHDENSLMLEREHSLVTASDVPGNRDLLRSLPDDGVLFPQFASADKWSHALHQHMQQYSHAVGGRFHFSQNFTWQATVHKLICLVKYEHSFKERQWNAF